VRESQKIMIIIIRILCNVYSPERTKYGDDSAVILELHKHSKTLYLNHAIIFKNTVDLYQ